MSVQGERDYDYNSVLRSRVVLTNINSSITKEFMKITLYFQVNLGQGKLIDP